MKKFGRVGVLMGGPSSEREISLESGKAVFQALANSGLEVVAIDIKTSDSKENIRLISSQNLDCAFIALHGFFGEDGKIQEILDNLRIPYTGSGKSASKLAMDKVASRKIIASAGLAVPRYRLINKTSAASSADIDFGLPWVIKPVAQGSSVGLSMIDRPQDFKGALEEAFKYDDQALVEEYISGRELTVGILGERALPVIEVIPKNKFFDYQAKYTPGMTEYIVPAKIEDGVARKTQEAALAVHRLLGCSGFSRVDIMLDAQNIPFVLELNSIPGLTQTSLLPKAARVAGIAFDKLCIRLIKTAYEKTEEKNTR